MLAAQYGTVSDIEIVWLLITGGGFLFCLLNLKESLKDSHALDSRGIKNGRRIWANLGVQTSAISSIVQAMYFGVGLLAATLKEVPQNGLSWKIILIGAAVRWGFITASALLTVKNILIYRARKKLLREGDNG